MSTLQRLTSQQKRHWNRNGYLILPGFFSREEVAAVNRIVDQRLALPSTFGNATVDPLQGPYAGQRFRAADAPSEVFKVPVKINDLFLDEPEVRNIALSERLTAILSELLGGPPMICNSLNFIWEASRPVTSTVGTCPHHRHTVHGATGFASGFLTVRTSSLGSARYGTVVSP